MNELLKNKVFLAFLGLVGLVIVCVIINNLTKTTTEDGEEIGALSALWRRLTKKDVVKKDDTDVVDDKVDDVVDDKVDDDEVDDVDDTLSSTGYTPDACKDSTYIQAQLLKSSTSVSTENGKRTLKSNNIPNHAMDGSGNKRAYAVCPTEYDTTHELPEKPSYTCGNNKYSSKNPKCVEFNTSYNQPYFGSLGVLGRPRTSGHWSEVNNPQEIIEYDPMPAECYSGTTLCVAGNSGCDIKNSCGATSDDDMWRFNIQGLMKNSPVYYDEGDEDNEQLPTQITVAVDEYQAHVQPKSSTGATLQSPDDADVGLYHYHSPVPWDNGAYKNQVIGYMNDGTPLMGSGSTVYDEIGNDLGEATTSYINLQGTSAEPQTEGSQKCIGGNSDLYHSCYDYEDTAGNLDRYNGGYTKEIDGELTYAYFSTGDEYPYLPIFIKGEF